MSLNEFNVTETARRLTTAGFPISKARLGQLISEGRGPPARKLIKDGLTRAAYLILWQDTVTWANNRTVADKGGALWGTKEETSQGMDPKLRMHDQIILYLRERHPDRWQQFSKIAGPERLERLNSIADQALQLAERLFLSQTDLEAHRAPEARTRTNLPEIG